MSVSDIEVFRERMANTGGRVLEGVTDFSGAGNEFRIRSALHCVRLFRELTGTENDDEAVAGAILNFGDGLAAAGLIEPVLNTEDVDWTTDEERALSIAAGSAGALDG